MNLGVERLCVFGMSPRERVGRTVAAARQLLGDRA